MVAAAHVHTIKRHGPDRCVGFTPIPAMSMASYAAGTRFLSLIGGVDPLLLRLVRGPAALLAAGVRRSDRRPGVRRLVQRRLPGHLGHEPADHPDPGRPLHDRGALPRPEGGRRLPRLRRAHQVRRPLAGRRARQRRGPGDGDGPRDPEGVLRRAAGPLLRGLRAPVHRPAPAGHIARARGRLRPRPAAARLRSRRLRRRARERRVEAGRDRRRHRRARRAERLGRPPLRRAGAVEPATSTASSRRSACSTAAASGSRSTCRASTSAPARAAPRSAAASRRCGSAASS